MLTTLKEVQGVLRNHFLHWSLRVLAVRRFMLSNPEMNSEQVAYQLNLNTKQVFRYKKLAEYLKDYPNLNKLKRQEDAHKLIKAYGDDPVIFNYQLKLALLTNKSKLTLKQIAKYVTGNTENTTSKKIRNNSGIT